MNPKIPKWPFRLLRWFCDPEIVEDIEGDLIERFEMKYRNENFSNWRLFRDILFLFRPGIIKSIKGSQNNNFTGIMRFHVLFAFRNFYRQKLVSLINVVGLASGLTCAMFIYLWVHDELQVDRLFHDDDRIYQVMMNDPNGNTIETGRYTPHLLAQSLKAEIGEIDQAIAMISADVVEPYLGSVHLYIDEKDISANGHFAESDFFNVFSYELLSGDAADVLKEPNSIVISRSLGEKLFGDYDLAVGQVIHWRFAAFVGDAMITGVYEDPPSNATSQFDLVFDFHTWYDIAKQMKLDVYNWGNHTPYTYVKLHDQANFSVFAKKLNDFTQTQPKISDKQLLPVLSSSLYLYGLFEDGKQLPGRAKQVGLFSVIGLLILLIAVINFMNLSTARASRRMKEVGIKKAMGIRRMALIHQFLIESILIVFIATTLSLVLTYFLLPNFNAFVEKELRILIDGMLVVRLLGVTLSLGLLAGMYPALYLSGMDTLRVLKNRVTTSFSSAWLRKGMVVFQFFITTLLISAAVVIYQQINYMQFKDLGYKGEKVIYFPSTENIFQQKEAFYSEMTKIPGVVDASGMSGNLIGLNNATSDFSWEGKDPNFNLDFITHYGDFRMAETLSLELIDGRYFSREFNEKRTIIFNETAIQTMGLEDPVGQSVKLWGMPFQIIGVVKDFHFESLYETIKPAALMIDYSSLFRMLVKLEGDDHFVIIDQIEEVYQAFEPDVHFRFQYLNQEYQELYNSDRKVSVLSRMFSGLAIVISCLGLLGLVTFTIQNQYKEIGIRKILGLTVPGVVVLLSRNFVKLILIAMLLALPISYGLAQEWLLQFAYHIELKIWMFGLAGWMSLAIAIVTIGSQSFRVARMNPTEAIKYE